MFFSSPQHKQHAHTYLSEGFLEAFAGAFSKFCGALRASKGFSQGSVPIPVTLGNCWKIGTFTAWNRTRNRPWTSLSLKVDSQVLLVHFVAVLILHLSSMAREEQEDDITWAFAIPSSFIGTATDTSPELQSHGPGTDPLFGHFRPHFVPGPQDCNSRRKDCRVNFKRVT